MELSNGPSLTVEHLWRTAQQLPDGYREPLVDALDSLRLSSNTWSFAPLAWLTGLAFTNGVKTWTLTREHDGQWVVTEDAERRGAPKGVVPLDAAYFYKVTLSKLDALKRSLKDKRGAPRHHIGLAEARRMFDECVTNEYLRSILTVQDDDGDPWVFYHLSACTGRCTTLNQQQERESRARRHGG